jgi:hypothetical protein
MPGEFIDLTSNASTQAEERATPRPFVGIHFRCCDVYTRIYINRDTTAYDGHCPKCAKIVRLRIAPGGTNARFFEVV